MELRCDSKKQAVLFPGEYLEVKCDSRFCGAQRGSVVLHRFDLQTGALIKTLRYSNPERKER